MRRSSEAPPWWSSLRGWMRRLATLSVGIAAASLVAMMFLDAVHIFGTKLFNRPLAGASEATEALMVLVVFLALASAHAHREHVVVDLVTTRLRAATRRWLDVAGQLLMLVFFALLAWQAWRLGLASYAIRETAAGIVLFPIYPSKLALAVGATLAALQAAAELGAAFIGTGSSETRA